MSRSIKIFPPYSVNRPSTLVSQWRIWNPTFECDLSKRYVSVAAVAAADAESLATALRATGTATVEVEGEPVEVTTDDEFLGGIIGDLNQRRGQIQDVEQRGTKRIVKAKVALRNMFGYSTRMRSLSEGRATYTMTFDSYGTLEA